MNRIIFITAPPSENIHSINYKNIYSLQEREIEAGEVVCCVIWNIVKSIEISTPHKNYVFCHPKMILRYINDTNESVHLKKMDTIDKLIGDHSLDLTMYMKMQ